MAVAKNTLRILTLERLGETFNQQSCPLRYTPRKFVIHPEHKVCPLHTNDMAAAACVCHNSIIASLLMAPSCSKLCVSCYNASTNAFCPSAAKAAPHSGDVWRVFDGC